MMCYLSVCPNGNILFLFLLSKHVASPHITTTLLWDGVFVLRKINRLFIKSEKCKSKSFQLLGNLSLPTSSPTTASLTQHLNTAMIINCWKPSGSIACTRKQQLRFYWSRSSVVMNDDTPLTPPPPSARAELHFQM